MKKDGTSRLVMANFPDSYAEFRAQAAAGTLALDLLFNAAGWRQLPTVLAKANLLTDEAEKTIWGSIADRTVNQALLKLFSELQVPRFLRAYTTAGSYQWTVPADGDYVVVIIGGGGSGGAACPGSAAGGAAGYVSFWRGTLAAGVKIALVVGKGGQAITVSSGCKSGSSGGTSSFNGTTADGGGGGGAAEDGYTASGGYGGQCASAHDFTGIIPMGGVMAETNHTSSARSYMFGTPIPAIFLDGNGLPISCLCAGGNSNQNTARSLPNGKTMSAGVRAEDGGAAATAPTDCGAGGGAARCGTKNATTSAAGADGGVFIFKVMGGDLT